MKLFKKVVAVFLVCSLGCGCIDAQASRFARRFGSAASRWGRSGRFHQLLNSMRQVHAAAARRGRGALQRLYSNPRWQNLSQRFSPYFARLRQRASNVRISPKLLGYGAAGGLVGMGALKAEQSQEVVNEGPFSSHTKLLDRGDEIEDEEKQKALDAAKEMITKFPDFGTELRGLALIENLISKNYLINEIKDFAKRQNNFVKTSIYKSLVGKRDDFYDEAKELAKELQKSETNLIYAADLYESLVKKGQAIDEAKAFMQMLRPEIYGKGDKLNRAYEHLEISLRLQMVQ